MNRLQSILGLGLGKRLVFLALMALSLLAGCASPQQNPYLYTGAGLGAATGAALGAGLNHRNPWKGAAIGGLLGTAIGGVAGEAYGQSKVPYQPQPYYQSPQSQGYYQPQPQGYDQQQPYYGSPSG
jgi:hypothetical protein